jgi:ParB-like chromosome segregation protein Spo0J
MIELSKVDPSNLGYHRLATIFPLIEGDAFEELKASIKENRIREPIVLFEGKILDGRNRYRAAKEIGYEFSGKDFAFFTSSEVAAEAFVSDINIHRRHLTTKDREKAARELLTRYPDYSTRQIAKLCGLSHVTIANYRKPPSDKKYAAFMEAWGKLDVTQRERFVREARFDIVRAGCKYLTLREETTKTNA